MRLRLRVWPFLLTSVVAVACGGTDDAPRALVQPAESGGDGGAVSPGLGPPADPTPDADCVAPDMLIALDRTLTMSRRPDGTASENTRAGRAQTRWAMAIDAVRRVTAPPLDAGVRFGLELWPRHEEGCVTLAERLGGAEVTNDSCTGGEVVVAPTEGAGAAIAAELDAETTEICRSTPTGTALLDAKASLDAIRQEGRKQYVALVTDGADWDKSCPDPDPRVAVDQLFAAGIGTLVVGFSAEEALVGRGSDRDFLNDVACAGGTAKGFPDTCERRDGVYRARAGTDALLFYSASNTAELVDGVSTFARSVCCGCVK